MKSLAKKRLWPTNELARLHPGNIAMRVTKVNDARALLRSTMLKGSEAGEQWLMRVAESARQKI